MSIVTVTPPGTYAPIPTIDAHTRRAASLLVCAHSTDTDDARTLLTVLGLIDEEAA